MWLHMPLPRPMCVSFSLYRDVWFAQQQHKELAWLLIFCFQVGVVEAVPRWGKNSKLVLVTLLLAGLLLAALLVAGYYLKTHRKNSKGVRLVSRWEGVCHTVGAKWLTVLWLLKPQATFVFTPQTLLPSSCLSYIQMHSWSRPLLKKTLENLVT